MATVFLDGKFVSQDEARVSAFDAAVQHGVGLFETMVGGIRGAEEWDEDADGRGEGSTAGEGSKARVFQLEEHLERLISSARELGLSDELRAAPLAEAVLRTVEKSGLERARVRLTITGGDLNLLARAQEAKSVGSTQGQAPQRVRPTLMIVAQPATQYPEEMFDRGVGVAIADLRTNPLDPLAGHKTVNYWGRLRELQTAAAKQMGEALVFQVTNYLAGGCVSNAFVVRGEELWTPIARGEEGDRGGETKASGAAVPSPVLPGMTRAWALEWAAKRGMPVRRRMVSIEDVLKADEVFLTNSSWGVLPVVRVERERIGGGAVGEVARGALAAWRDAAGMRSFP